MIGEFLYALTGRDEAQPVIERLAMNLWNTAAAATVSVATPGVPNDRAWWITNIVVYGFAAALVNSWRVEVRDANGQVITQLAREVGTPAQERAGNYPCEAMIMPNEFIELDMFFSSAAANFPALSLIGFVIPRGNLQLR